MSLIDKSAPSTSNGDSSTAANSAASGVRSVFMSGFPADFQERELANMFLFFEGFEAAQFHEAVGTKSSMGFVRFATAAQAAAVCKKLDGKQIDPAYTCALRVKMARKDLKRQEGALPLPRTAKRPRTDDATAALHQAMMAGGLTAQQQLGLLQAIGGGGGGGANGSADPFGLGMPLGFGATSGASGPSSMSSQGKSSWPKAPTGPMLGAGLGGAAMLGMPPMHSLPGMDPAAPPPSSTLYVGRLGRATTEKDLLNVFSAQPGFTRLAFTEREGRQPTCFVEFSDAWHASQAMARLQGAVLTVGGVGIKVEFSKNPLGIKR